MLKKELQVEKLYEAVRDVSGNDLFLASLCLLVSNKRTEYLETIRETKCFAKNPPPPDFKKTPTTYDDKTFEYFMWMNSLISMCWLLANVKHKTEDGHCYNPIHDDVKSKTDHPLCPDGSEFHSKFYDNVIDSLERLTKYAKDNRPMVISKTLI